MFLFFSASVFKRIFLKGLAAQPFLSHYQLQSPFTLITWPILSSVASFFAIFPSMFLILSNPFARLALFLVWVAARFPCSVNSSCLGHWPLPSPMYSAGRSLPSAFSCSFRKLQGTECSLDFQDAH